MGRQFSHVLAIGKMNQSFPVLSGYYTIGILGPNPSSSFNSPLRKAWAFRLRLGATGKALFFPARFPSKELFSTSMMQTLSLATKQLTSSLEILRPFKPLIFEMQEISKCVTLAMAKPDDQKTRSILYFIFFYVEIILALHNSTISTCGTLAYGGVYFSWRSFFYFC